MNSVDRIDLNLLVYLDALLEEASVTRAADRLNITQPAMSNGLRRLREAFGDPLLIRTSEGMTPTEYALRLRPSVREALGLIERTIQPQSHFDPGASERVFRLMTSDYAEATLLPQLLEQLRQKAPLISLDVLTPSDVSFRDVEQGRVDMAINRFDDMPGSFHQNTVWFDNFSCLMHRDNPLNADFTLTNYIEARHIWVSKTGMGKGVGMGPRDVQRFGRVDEALAHAGLSRRISVFTRHYQVATLLAAQPDLVATIPTRLARQALGDTRLVSRKPPFAIPPFELKMVWSPLLHHNNAHRWFRQQVMAARDAMTATPEA